MTHSGQTGVVTVGTVVAGAGTGWVVQPVMRTASISRPGQDRYRILIVVENSPGKIKIAI